MTGLATFISEIGVYAVFFITIRYANPNGE